MKRYVRTLTIAGSDSGGGAGIQADLKTFAALGCYGMSALTALTAQNTVGVTDIHPVPAAFVARQIDAVLDDIGVDAVKVGMLHSAEVIATVADRLRHHRVEQVVVDPVMVATSGDRLLHDDAVAALTSDLLPLATVITPNAPEAAVLLGREAITSLDELEDAGRALARTGPGAVLVKGGHLSGGRSVDVLYLADDDVAHRLDAPRIDTPNTHGTGCTLSSAICAHLARGHTVRESVELAKAYMTEAIRAGAGYELGRGHGPVHHFHGAWD
ncbi:MAG TPA: bifunctional hydroxymethylpyrimidine kinase/phosphomethylpyrimidine kinase [Euzebyales bacterium]|nr:bifunctional hydroxymethylpyrimidine kinase/phosphomethylpyrimidine kinase [Euzebyales bacterium]